LAVCASSHGSRIAMARYRTRTVPPRQPRNDATKTSEQLRPLRVKSAPPVVMSAEEMDQLECELDLMECEENGDWLGAQDILEDMVARNVTRRRQAWQSSMNAHAKAGRWEDAARLLEEMERAGVQPDQEAFHAALEACEGQNAPHQAAKLYQEMKERGFNPTVITYIKVVSLLSAAGRKEEAMKVYVEAREKGFLWPWIQNGQFLDLREYAAPLSEVIIRAACMERATEVWAGRGGFHVQLGTQSADDSKLRVAKKVIQDEFGLKVRIDPKRFGHMRVAGGELKRLAQERILSGKQARPANEKERREVRSAYEPMYHEP